MYFQICTVNIYIYKLGKKGNDLCSLNFKKMFPNRFLKFAYQTVHKPRPDRKQYCTRIFRKSMGLMKTGKVTLNILQNFKVDTLTSLNRRSGYSD